ncbi:hypothetical protein [Arenimonas alkanexedens]
MLATCFLAYDDEWRGIFIRQMAFALARRPGMRREAVAPPEDTPRSDLNQPARESTLARKADAA